VGGLRSRSSRGGLSSAPGSDARQEVHAVGHSRLVAWTDRPERAWSHLDVEDRLRRRRGVARALTLIVLCLVVVPAGRDDIGIRLDRTYARPGDRVRAISGEYFLSLYLAPASTVPQPRSCRGGTATCEPTSLGPPKRKGWVWLGRFFPTRPSFHFRVPAVRAGAYRPVVYCAPCTRGRRGSLIAGNRFHVLPPAR
jgi:hypothetical protein